jgi:hypothetical protein
VKVFQEENYLANWIQVCCYLFDVVPVEVLFILISPFTVISRLSSIHCPLKIMLVELLYLAVMDGTLTRRLLR